MTRSEAEPCLQNLDSMMENSPPGVRPLLQTLLGCGWGRQVWTEDDSEECGRQAVQIVVLHGDDEVTVKLCAVHRERVQQETTPHKEGD